MLTQALLWTVLGASVVLARSPRPLAAGARWRELLGFLTLFLLALAARLVAPFWLLHSNDHAYDDIALVLDVPPDNPVARAELLRYGEAWTALQTWGTHVLGQTHDGIALLSVLLGALAVLATVVAAHRLLGARPSVWLAGQFAALVPVGVRVGHSESAFVVAQLLIAVGLLLAASLPSRWTHAGLVAVVLLLATGHALGAGYAVGFALLAWSLQRQSWRVLLLLVVAASVGVGWDWSHNQARLIDRGSGSLAPWELIWPIRAHTLWLDAAWVPPAWPLLALVGVAAWVRAQPSPRWPQVLVALLGVLALAVTGLLPICCASDVLRYQAAWLPVVALALAHAGGVGEVASPRLRNFARFAVVSLWLLLAFQGVRSVDGFHALDAQGQTYAALRQGVDPKRESLTFVVPEFAGNQRAYLAAPAGRWGNAGPNVLAMRVDVARFHCERYGKLPGYAVLALEPSCATTRPEDGPCASVLPFAGKQLFAEEVRPLPRRMASTAAEFLDLGEGVPRLEVWEARCPTPTGR